MHGQGQAGQRPAAKLSGATVQAAMELDGITNTKDVLE